MGKKLIPDDAWSAAIGAISKTTDYSNWKWSDVAKAAGAGLAVYAIGNAVNGRIKVTTKGSPKIMGFSCMSMTSSQVGKEGSKNASNNIERV